jgi:CheY-like chemotaxis protein
MNMPGMSESRKLHKEAETLVIIRGQQPGAFSLLHRESFPSAPADDGQAHPNLMFASRSWRIANDGDEAIARAAELQPRLILLDVMMTGRDGISVFREIRGGLAASRVVFLTGPRRRATLRPACRSVSAEGPLRRRDDRCPQTTVGPVLRPVIARLLARSASGDRSQS